MNLGDITGVLKPLGKYLKRAGDGSISERDRRKLEKALEELAELGSEPFEEWIKDPANARKARRAGKRILQAALLMEILETEL